VCVCLCVCEEVTTVLLQSNNFVMRE
jgi:hypothetical protein